MYGLIAGFALLSGATGLIYEIAWVRMLGYSVGSDSAAISIVLSAFFLGMALGSYSLSRFARDKNLSIKHYIGLELTIGVFGLLLLSLLTRLDLFIAVFPDFAATLFGKFLVSQLLLFVPTLCLGAAFPLLAALLIRSQHDLGLRISQLYTFNILGAILGALATGFIFVPTVGLDGSVYIAASINISIALIAWINKHRFSIVLAQSCDDNVIQGNTVGGKDKVDTDAGSEVSIAKVCLALSGFTLIACEIAWTKYFSIVAGSSLYSFSVVLAVTLAGIAAGSWLISRHIDRQKCLTNWLISLLLMLAVVLLLQKYLLSYLPIAMKAINHADNVASVQQLYRYGLVFVFLFPVTLCFGLLFPIALRLYTQRVEDVKTRMSYAFAINTFASIVGAILIGFWIMPVFGSDTLLKIIILMFAITAMIGLIIQQNSKPQKLVISLITALILLTLNSAPIDYKNITEASNPYEQASGNNKPPDFLYLAEGKHSVVSLLSYDKNYAVLKSNGLQESMIALNDSAPPLTFETLQAYMPYFFQDKSDSAFVIGYGGGNTTQALLDTPIKSVTVVEIESEIVNAVKQIPGGPARSLKDERVKLIIGDARTHLLMSANQYDIITSQPSHPWLTGSANILTQEFFSLAKSRLSDDGIMTQWIALFRMETTALKSILKAFYTVFPHGFTLEHRESGDMMLIGAKKAMRLDYSSIAEKMQEAAIANKLRKLNIKQPEDLLWFYQLSRQDVMSSVADVLANTDMNIISEVRLAAIHQNDVGAEDPLRYLYSLARMDVSSLLRKDEAKMILFKAGLKFLDWGAEKKTALVIAQLNAIDERWSVSLRHELLYWKMDYQAATDLYLQRLDWLDITNYRQFEISLDSQPQTSGEFINKVTSLPLKQLMHVQLLYKNQDWHSISMLGPLDIQTQRWQLASLIRQGNSLAVDQLAAITPANYKNVEFLKILQEAFDERGEFEKAQWMREQLKNLYTLKILFYRYLLGGAQTGDNEVWNNSLKQKIVSLKSLLAANERYGADGIPEGVASR